MVADIGYGHDMVQIMDRALKKLNELNPDIDILSIEDSSFLRYGRVHHGCCVDVLLGALDGGAEVGDGVTRTEMNGAATRPAELASFLREVFGPVELQMECVWGRNTRLSALEYHKSAEVAVAGTDMIVLLGLVCDISWPAGTFDVSRTRAFFIPRGTVYEISPWCLHHYPVHVYESEGFRCLVILPHGAHAPIDFIPQPEGEGKLMQGRNTWLIAHPEDPGSQGTSAHLGLKGRTMDLRTL